jgi:hypothetical protein
MSDATRRPRSITVAEAISNVLSPPAVLAIMGFVLALIAAPFMQAMEWAFLHGVFVSLIPVIYIVAMLKLGRITDLHMHRRQERIRPFIIGVTTALVAWALLTAFGAPPMVRRLALFDAALLTVLGLITVWWQISFHGAAIVGAVTITGAVLGLPVALTVSPLVLVVAWARLYLRRHTIRQVLAGAALGAIVALLIFVFL